MLLCNDDKTELMLFASEDIIPDQIARNIGLVMHTGLPFSTHVSNLVSAAFFHLKNIASIYDHLTHDAAQTLVHAYVTNTVDCCNCAISSAKLPHYKASICTKFGCQITHKFSQV